MKISDKTLRAAEKAAKQRGKTLDAWAEEVLSAAAAAKPATIEARLNEISDKLDRIADRQGLGEMATDRLSAALQELESAFQRGKKGAGEILGKAEARTSSAAGEVAEKVRELVSRASDFVGPLSPRRDEASEDAPPPRATANSTATNSPGKAAGQPSAKQATSERTRKTTGTRKKATIRGQSRSKRGARSKASAARRGSRRPA